MNPMTRIFLGLFLITPYCVIAQHHLKLWYAKPAKEWTAALPLGNGRLGAMIFGRTSDELIQLNEATLWSGGPVKTNINPDAVKYLAQVREALLVKQDMLKPTGLRKKCRVYILNHTCQWVI
jgi:alpha-L-fucosidase 2